MMDLQTLNEILSSTGLPVTYRAWPEGNAPPMPYICYLCAYSSNFIADGEVYFPINHVQVELYTALKSPDVEAQVESALAGIPWEKTETYIDSEKCYQILYEIEV